MRSRFSLQSVLDFRHSRVESLQIELGQWLARRQQAAVSLNEMQTQRARLFSDLGSLQQGVIDFQANHQTRINLRVIEASIHEQQLLLRQLEQKVSQKQAEVLAARQDEETLETLKSKEQERQRLEQVARDNRQQDDIYIARAFRQLSH